MERYSEYKDSGVKWLGEIPSHWEVKRLASYFTERRVKVSDKDYEPLSVTKQGVFPQWENVAKTNDGDNRKYVKKGDFVINSRSDRKGSSGVADRDGSVSLINIVLQPRKTVSPRFTLHLLKSYKFIEEYYRNGRGIVADLWTTRFDEMKMIKLAVPPVMEQTAIANYLDSVTSKIDEAIAQQQKMIDLLNERKQIIINNAVTKGLDPNVKMKPSGVDWIEDIPEHWEMVPVRRITSSHLQGYYDPDGYVDNGYRLLRITDLQEGGKVTFEQAPFVKHTPSIKDFLLKPGDFCFARTGGAGSFGYISEIKEPAVFASYLIRFRFVNQNNDFLRYYFLSKNFKDEIQSLIHGGVNQNIHAENIKDAHITIPPINEQRDIVSYIETNCEPINNAARVADNQISLLQERKQIIINDVVTGKVKVV